VFGDVPHSRFSVTLSLTMHNGFLKILGLTLPQIYTYAFHASLFYWAVRGFEILKSWEAAAVNYGKAMVVDPVSDPQ